MKLFSVFSAASTVASFALLACEASAPIRPTGLPAGPSVAPSAQASADTWIVSTAADPQGSTELASLTRQPTVFLRDGSFAMLSELSSDGGLTGAVAFLAIGRDGQLHSTLVSTDNPQGECELQLSGEGVVRACRVAEDGPYSVRYVSRQGLVDWGTAPGRAVISAAGDAMAVAGRCDPSESDDGVTFCQYSRETRRWSEWRAERRGFLLAQRAQTALITEPTEAGPKLVMYDILQGHRTPIESTDPTLELRAAALTDQDDRVLVLASRALRGGEHEAMVGFARPGVPATLHAVGIDAVDVAFADERRGIAIGAHADEIAITSDGGLTWTKVLPSGHATPATVSFVPANDRRFRASTPAELRTRRLYPAGTLVHCNVSVCVAGRLVHRWQAE